MMETLRYFYSAVFQGFAALITLGGMFYIFFKQYIDSNKDKLEENMYKLYSGNYMKIYQEGIINFVDQQINDCEKQEIAKNGRYYAAKSLRDKHKIFEGRFDAIKIYIPCIVVLTTIILIFSLVSLFSLVYCTPLNILLIIAILIGLLSIIDVVLISYLILKIFKV